MTRVNLPTPAPSRSDVDACWLPPAVLPSAAHPSYPYGNPHATRPGGPSSTTPSVGSTSSLFRPNSSAQSLATSLPVLAIRHLHAVTTFGDARDRTWSEMALDDLLPQRDDDDGRDGTQGQAGDAPQPTGQAAGDDPPDEEGEAVMEDV